jgi:hypothetical protein
MLWKATKSRGQHLRRVAKRIGKPVHPEKSRGNAWTTIRPSPGTKQMQDP